MTSGSIIGKKINNSTQFQHRKYYLPYSREIFLITTWRSQIIVIVQLLILNNTYVTQMLLKMYSISFLLISYYLH